MRSIRRTILCALLPGALALTAIGAVNLSQHSSSTASVPRLHVTVAQALAAKSEMMRHGTLEADAGDTFVQDGASPSKPTEGTKAGEPTVDSLFAQETAERSFQGQTASPAMVQNGVDQYNFLSNSTLPGRWTSLGPNYNPNSNNPDPITQNQLAISGRVSALAVVPSTCTSTTCGTMYVGPANGGVWKTTDGGASWTALTDNLLNTAIGYIAIDPVNSNIIYLGTGEPNVAGDTNRGIGLLRSTDAGATWTQLDRSDFVNRAISTIIIDPRTAGSANATLYVTSHRAINGSDYSQSAGCSRCTPNLPAVGFYKSTNGGTSFTLSNPAGVNPNAGSQSLVIDPSNPNTLYLGISGDAANDFRHFYDGAGLYKSTDDGATWTALTTGFPASRQDSATNTSGATTSIPRFDRITIAVGTDNPNVVYVATGRRSRTVVVNGPALARTSPREQIFKSTDAGASFSLLSSAPNACSPQCSYDMPLAVDPSNSNILYAGGVANYDWVFGGNPACYVFSPYPASGCATSLMKTTDGGVTWRDIAENATAGTGPLHPDDHVLVVAPGHSNVVFSGSDGGLFKSTDSGAIWTDLNHGLDTLQAESVAVGPTGNVFFGTQDNGTYRLIAGSTDSLHVGFGDGGVSNADPVDPSVAYYTQYGGLMERDNTANLPSASHWNPFSNGSGTFISPAWAAYYYLGRGLFYEPNATSSANHDLLFQGGDTLYRSTNQGGVDTNHNWDATDAGSISTWAPISPRLSGGASVSAIATSPTDPNTVAFATSAGQVFLTHNALAPVVTQANTAATDPFGVDRTCNITQDPLNSLDGCSFVSGVTWTNVGAGLPGRWITSLKWAAPGTDAAGSLYAVASSFGAFTPTNAGHVYKLAAGDSSFADISGTNSHAGALPDLPTNDIVVSPTTGHLYVAADYGVFISTNDGITWKRWDNSLPNVPVYMMAWNPTTNKLVVGTHGRGIWTVQAP